MTTVQNGVGESFRLREKSSSFLDLKDGGQIPGYQGHCPTLRFDYGKTYGQGTHEAHQTRKSFGTEGQSIASGQQQQRSLEADTLQPITTKKGQLRASLPQSTGDNKYTEDMVSGYTGYIPRYPFKFGATYKDECDICLDEHFANMRRQQALRRGPLGGGTLGGGPQAPLQALKQDPEVRDRLNEFGTIVTSATETPRRGVYSPPKLERDCELPIPGYAGFVPRVGVTEAGLGTRYTPQTKNGLDWFYAEQARRGDLLSTNPEPPARSDVTSPSATTYVCEHRTHNPGGLETTNQRRPPKAVSFVV